MDEIQHDTGIPTIFIEAKLETIPRAFETLGDILSKEEEARALVEYSEKAIEDAKKFVNSQTKEDQIRLFYGIGRDGLDTNAKSSFHAEVFDFIGLDNVAVLDQVSS